MIWYVSEFNRMAVQSLREYDMQRAPASLLICGPPGIGKTELLRRFGHRFKETEGVLMLDAGAFLGGFAFAAQEGGLRDFRLKIRKSKLLIFDHLEKLRGKPLSIEEFLHTYEELAAKSAKIVTAFQGETGDLGFLGEKLSSRLLGGLVLPIHPLMGTEKAAYLERYTRSRYLIVEESVLEGIAQRITSFPQAQTMINAFVRFADAMDSALDFATFATFLHHWEEQNRALATPENIVHKTSQLCGIPVVELLSSKRTGEVVKARQMAISAIRTLCQASYPEIGRYFGRAHSTVLKAHEHFLETLKSDPDWNEKYLLLRTFFQRRE